VSFVETAFSSPSLLSLQVLEGPSDTRVYEPQIRARLGTTAHLCRVVVPTLRAVVGVLNDQWTIEAFRTEVSASSSSILSLLEGT